MSPVTRHRLLHIWTRVISTQTMLCWETMFKPSWTMCGHKLSLRVAYIETRISRCSLSSWTHSGHAYEHLQLSTEVQDDKSGISSFHWLISHCFLSTTIIGKRKGTILPHGKWSFEPNIFKAMTELGPLLRHPRHNRITITGSNFA